MPFVLSSNLAASLCSSPSLCSSSLVARFLLLNPRSFSVALPPHRISRSVLVLARRRNQKAAVTSSSPQRRNKKGFGGDNRKEEDEDLDDDPFEALFSQLEEDLKNGNSPIDDEDDDEINEEDIDALAGQLAEVLGGDGEMELFGSPLETNDGFAHGNDDDDDDDDEEDERPLKLKNWQLRRLAHALKAGRRKTSIKNLAAELCLDRAYVLKLLRDPPPSLLMLSATLPEEPPPVAVVLENKSPEPADEEITSNNTETETNVKEPVHVMQQRWSAKKRLKKVHIETLERVYRRSKRPTNAMISSVVQVTNLPRKRVVKWFEDKRGEDGIPENRTPYQRPV